MKHAQISYTDKPAPGLLTIITCVSLLAGMAPALYAASQTWTNAPADPYWSNTVNWVAGAIPGAVNSSGNGDTATFNAPIPGSGIGGAGAPITNDNQRCIRSVR